MILKEFFATLGLDLNEASFARGQLAADGVRFGIEKIAQAALYTGRALVGMVSGVIATADSLDEAAMSTGVNVEALQELTYAASFSSITAQTLSQSFGLLAKNAGAAKDGSEQAAKAFRAAGVSMADLKDKTPDQILMQLAERFKDMPDGMEKTALSMSLFGRSGKQMIPFLNEGAAGVGRLRQEARDLGYVMEAAATKAGALAADSMTKLKGAFTGLINSAIVPLLPKITALIESFAKWVKENKALISQRLGTVLTLIGFAFKAIFAVVGPLTKALSLMLKYWKLIALTLGGVLLVALIADTVAFWALGASAIQAGYAMIRAAIASAAAWVVAAAPLLIIAAIVALIILIIQDIWVGLNGGKSMIAGLALEWANFLNEWLLDTSGDPWWLVAIKGFLWTITHLGEAWDAAVAYWRDIFKSFFDWIEAKINKMSRAIDRINPFSVGSGETSGTRGVAAASEPAALVAARRGTAVLRGLGAPPSFGAGASPSASAASASGARGGARVTTLAPQNNITITGIEGAEKVAPQIETALEGFWQRKINEFHGATGGGD